MPSPDSARPDPSGDATAVPDLARLFEPRAVAVVGASTDRTRAGTQAIVALQAAGFAGPIYPVNPKREQIESLRCYPSIDTVPRPCDLAVVAVGAEQVPGVIRQCDAAGIGFAVVFSAGFREIGARGADAQAELDRAIREIGRAHV